MTPKRLFKSRYRREVNRLRVAGFIAPDGTIVSRFQDCSIVMVSPLNPRSGPSIPLSKAMFMPGTKVGDAFVEVIDRMPLDEWNRAT